MNAGTKLQAFKIANGALVNATVMNAPRLAECKPQQREPEVLPTASDKQQY